ncbi:hypothetical protein ONK55_22535, partial [Salmonella enterica subsp. enterica serovar Anatum]|nr:hypothetical protein [Salmonella enterica subsp. enterica serovar Anatum]
FQQLHLRGQRQSCWHFQPSMRRCGRRTAGKSPLLRNPLATLDVQVFLSSYPALIPGFCG